MITVIALSMIVLLIGLLIWLRRNPERSQNLDGRLLAIQPQFANPVRMVSFEIFFFGLFFLGFTMFTFTQGSNGQINGLARVPQPNRIAMMLAGYLIICSVLFFLMPLRAGMLFFGLGAILLGTWNILVVLASQVFQTKIRFMTIPSIESFLNKQPWPWIFALISLGIILHGIRMIRDYFKEEPIPTEGFENV